MPISSPQNAGIFSIFTKDFFWSYTDEPHASRRKEILSKYPQMKNLYGYDFRTKYIVVLWVFLQLSLAFAFRKSSWITIVFASYTLGAFPTHALFLAMHEIAHNLAFSKPVYNRLLGCFSNLATVFPHFSMFQRYHMEHHQYQGVDGIDSDIPSPLETALFTNIVMKVLWVFLQPLFYVIRPLFLKPKCPLMWDLINWGFCFAFDFLIVQYFGVKAISYLLLSALLSSGLHPTGGHFISEHYVFVKNQETYSYYGPLNILFFNVGYHNEHHDFPRIPGSRLPQLRAIAPEYYEQLPCYFSWTKVIGDFISIAHIGPFSLMKRRKAKSSTEEM